MTGTNSTRASFSKIRYVLGTVFTRFLDFEVLGFFAAFFCVEITWTNNSDWLAVRKKEKKVKFFEFFTKIRLL
jgi:hypothetical protein